MLQRKFSGSMYAPRISCTFLVAKFENFLYHLSKHPLSKCRTFAKLSGTFIVFPEKFFGILGTISK